MRRNYLIWKAEKDEEAQKKNQDPAPVKPAYAAKFILYILVVTTIAIGSFTGTIILCTSSMHCDGKTFAIMVGTWMLAMLLILEPKSRREKEEEKRRDRFVRKSFK